MSYRFSRSLRGDKILHIAREKRGSRWVVVARADTERKLKNALKKREKLVADGLIENEPEADATK
jgi:hypothetical protein